MSRFTPSRYIPNDSQKVASKRSTAVVYLYTLPRGKVAAVGYVGKSYKPVFHCSFATPERRTQYVRDWMTAQDVRVAEKAADKANQAALRAAGHGLKVGDVLVCSWGYDQTNIDFYEVTRLIGKASIGLRPIASEQLETLSMQGKCVPVPGQYTGPELVKRPSVSAACGVRVRITSFSTARPAERVTSVSGAFLGYRPHHWTAYA